MEFAITSARSINGHNHKHSGLGCSKGRQRHPPDISLYSREHGLLTLIHWKTIYPVDSIVQPSTTIRHRTIKYATNTYMIVSITVWNNNLLSADISGIFSAAEALLSGFFSSPSLLEAGASLKGKLNLYLISFYSSNKSLSHFDIWNDSLNTQTQVKGHSPLLHSTCQSVRESEYQICYESG